jgi:uncharacterized protein (TIGR02270 family)
MRAPKLVWDVVEESMDEAEFLWRRRLWLLDAHEGRVRDAATWAEERMLGALHGVRVAGDEGVDPLLTPALASDEIDRAAVAAFVLGALGTSRAWDLVERSLLAAPGPASDALIRGVGLLGPRPALAGKLAALLDAGKPGSQAVVLALLAEWAADPGSKLSSWLASADPDLLVAALRAIPGNTGAKFHPQILRNLNDPEPRVQIAAVQRGLVLRQPAAWSTCLALFERPTPALAPLLPLVAVSGEPRSLALLRAAIAVKELARDAVFSLGEHGTAEAAETAVELMAGDQHAALAAASFAAITGVDLRAEHLVKPESPDSSSGGDADSPEAAERRSASPDDDLPAPDVGALIGWWRKNQSRFPPRARFIRGQPARWSVVRDTLENGPPARRHALACELEVRTEGRFRLATRALAGDQERQLRQLAAVDAASFAKPPFPGWAPLPSS